MQAPYPTVDESLDRLHRAGWSVGHTGATLWLVSGSNGENAISASGRSLAEVSQATAIGNIVDPPVEFASCWRPDPVPRTPRPGVGQWSLPALIEALAGPEAKVRALAADTLGRTGPNARPAVPALLNAVHDKEGMVREAAARALQRIDPLGPTRVGRRGWASGVYGLLIGASILGTLGLGCRCYRRLSQAGS